MGQFSQLCWRKIKSSWWTHSTIIQVKKVILIFPLETKYRHILKFTLYFRIRLKSRYRIFKLHFPGTVRHFFRYLSHYFIIEDKRTVFLISFLFSHIFPLSSQFWLCVLHVSTQHLWEIPRHQKTGMFKYIIFYPMLKQ